MSTVGELNDALNGRLCCDGTAEKTRAMSLGKVQSDSRRIEPGDIFWALRGPNHEGEQFAAEAFRRGAAGAVVAKDVEVPRGCWTVRADDTYQALLDWARYRRKQFNGVVIGVTGSAGKTTTREMIHAVLRSKLRGTASPRNFNNGLGVPLSMTAMEPNHDYAVLEFGASHLREIETLTDLAKPDIGVITQIGDAHLGEFGSRERIAFAKAELLEALPPDGAAVLGDDPWLRSVSDCSEAPVVWVGAADRCDIVATHVHDEGGRLTFCVDDCQFCIPVWGRHHLTAALSAIAVGEIMGFDLDEIARCLYKFHPMPMRCEVREIRGATIINDAYNSNPTAMLAALELLSRFKTPGRRIVVAGDMAELGDDSAAIHWQLGKQIVETGHADLLVACGEFARQVVDGARAKGMPRLQAIPCRTVDEAMPFIDQAVSENDVVLIKGSRRMALERVVEMLARHSEKESRLKIAG